MPEENTLQRSVGGLRRRIPRKSRLQVLLVIVPTDVRPDNCLAPCRATGIDPDDLLQNCGLFAVTIVYIYAGQPCFPFAGLRQSKNMGYQYEDVWSHASPSSINH